MPRLAALCLLTISVLATAAGPLPADPSAATASVPAPVASVRDTGSVPIGSLPKDTAGAGRDSLKPGWRDSLHLPVDSLHDTTKSRMKKAVKDTTAKHIPPRILTFDQQLLFALVFMCYLAAMTSSLTNFNP